MKYFFTLPLPLNNEVIASFRKRGIRGGFYLCGKKWEWAKYLQEMCIKMKSIQDKIQIKGNAQQTVADWHANGLRVVFTNGCFDILHYGHIQYLEEARNLGDRLVVGLNASASVSRLKGPRRPINDEKTRSFLMAALQMVDLVVVFEEDTPYNLIQTLQPDILVKGGDWKPEQIVGSDLVLARGGEVRSLRFAEGYSTTNIEQKIILLAQQ